MSLRSLVVGSAAVVALGCAREPAPVASAPQQLTITANDFAYVLPATPIRAGLTRMTLVNNGQELHHVQLLHLADGKTTADLAAALGPDGATPDWAVPAGGPNGALPGSEANATLILEPGEYALLCRIPSADGVSHLAKGMILGMQVLPADGPAAPLPAGDIQMGLFDYGFSMTPPPNAGTHTFVVTNQASQPHEVVLVRLEPGATMEPWKDWLVNGMQGPPPGVPFGGLVDLAPGQVQNFTADLPPGNYGLICFVPDAADGQPHLFHGMMSSFTVS